MVLVIVTFCAVPGPLFSREKLSWIRLLLPEAPRPMRVRSAWGLVMVMTGPVWGPMLVPLDSKNSASGVKVPAAVEASMVRSMV